jgi:hypothetical protein
VDAASAGPGPSREAIAQSPRGSRPLCGTKTSHLGSRLYVGVFKQEQQFEIWIRRGDRYEQFKTYPICAYSALHAPPHTTPIRRAATPERHAEFSAR